MQYASLWGSQQLANGRPRQLPFTGAGVLTHPGLPLPRKRCGSSGTNPSRAAQQRLPSSRDTSASFRMSPNDEELGKTAEALAASETGQPGPDPEVDGTPVLASSLSPAPEWASGNLARKLWWGYNAWLCTQWLNLAVYGNVDLASLASLHPAIIVAANHQSELDFAVLVMALRSLGIDEVLYVAEKDFTTTLANRLYDNAIPVLRAAHRGLTTKETDAIREAVEGPSAAADGEGADAAAAAAAGVNIGGGDGKKRAIVVFPERTVGGREDSVRPWRVGVGYLSSKLQYPVVPAFISGTQRALPPLYSIPTKGAVGVEFGLFVPPPADTAGTKEASLMDPEISMSAARKAGLSQLDAQLQAAVMALRSSLRARRAKWTRNQARNRRVPRGSGPAAWVAAATQWLGGSASVAVAAVLMLLLRALDTVKVLLLRAASLLRAKAQEAVETKSA